MGITRKVPNVTAAGFTLVELMVTMLISAAIMTAVFSSYISQQKNYAVQESVVEMQQNLRTGIFYMTRDIREAGCDPTGLANAKIITAEPGSIRFSRDIGGSPGNPNLSNGVIDTKPGLGEDVSFGFSNTYDSNGNGIADGGGADWSSPGELGKDTGAGFQSISDSISAIEFNYILTGGATTPAPTGSQLNSIIGVQVSLLARASKADRKFNNTITYTTAAGTDWGPFNDNFRRRLDTATIQLRNFGM
ncbi:MAG: PilW family protein [Desulfocapsa sp.]|nr:PilW family protein [Desulfocapsa sp.]